MSSYFCESCGMEAMASMVLCPSCGGRKFSNTPPASSLTTSVGGSSQSSSTNIQSSNAQRNKDFAVSDITKRALESLKGQWLMCAGMTFVQYIILGGVQSIPTWGLILYLILVGPFGVSWSIIGLKITRNERIRFSDMFLGFNSTFIFAGIVAGILTLIFTYLWALLLFIPGIIAALSYSLTYFLISEDSTLSPLSAISKSKSLMDGYKSKLFIFWLQCMGWGILSILTLGIGLLFLLPFYYVSIATLYREITD